jgi:predicted MFS family arabinose efflux permease
VIADGKSSSAEGQSPWGLIFILFGAGILSAFQVGKAPPVLSDMRADLGISLFDAGWLLSVFTFTGLLMGTFTGAVADALGHRRLMLAGLVLQAAGSLSGSFSLSYPGLLATRILEGTGDLKLALSVWACYLPLGVSLMMVLLPVILAGTDWRGVWQINAAALFVYTLFLSRKTASIRFMNPSRGIRFKKILEDMVTTLKSPGPLLLSLIFVTYTLQWLSVMGFLPTLINEKYGFSKSGASLLTAGMVFVNIFGNLAAGRLLEMGLARFKLIALAGVVMGTSAIVIYLDTPHFIINYSGCLIFSIFGGLIPACVLGAVPAYAPSGNRVATTNGLVIQFGQLGQVIGPPVLAFLVSQTGSWTAGSWFLGCVAGLGVILSFFLSRIHPRQRGGDRIRD